jgi:hypothetical protein
MPVYKGTNEVTSGNLRKGSTEIQNGYKATNPFFVNETTLTIAFVDNTSANINLSSAASVSFTGTPGDTWSSFTRNLTRANGTVRITGAAGAESGDTQNILSIVESGSGVSQRDLTFSGTLPTVTQTITVTVTDTVVNLIARSLSVGPGENQGSSNYSSAFTISWNGDGTPTISGSSNYGAGKLESVGSSKPVGQIPFSGTPPQIQTPSSTFNTLTNGQSVYSDVNQTGGTYPKTNTFTISMPETLTYQAGSVSASYSQTSP